MRVIFLGTNGWYDTETGNTICILIETDDYYIILDAGNGLYKIDKYISSKKPIYLFLSHFHLDHIVGLHTLNKFKFSQRIRIYGQVHTKDILNTVITEPYTIPFAKLPSKVEVHELSEGVHNIPFLVKCLFLQHSSKCMGYRFEFQNKVISYCPDTKTCENAVELAKNADLLITECSFGPGQYNEKWPHLNPEEAAKIAKESGAKKLVLVHFDASIYQTLQKRKTAEKKAAEIFNNTIIAVDDMEIEV